MTVGKKTLLVLEDERSLNHAVTRKLEMSGYEVVSAASVDEGLKKLESNNVKAVWVDHYLRGHKNGLDFVMKLKDDQKTARIPLFIVSNTASDDKVKSYIRLGVNKYYVKANHSLNEIIKDIDEALEE